MDDLVQWLRAQLDEDERIALKSIEQAIVNLAGADAASVADWHVAERAATGTFVATRDQWDRVTEIVPTYGGAHSAHIAEHDPARVLRDIEAKRQIVKQHRPVGYGGVCLSLCHTRAPGQPQTWPCLTLRLLALPFADRPGFQESWRP
jgi:hypothetical protein